ncbi:glycosyltransferase [Arthrobacter sp. VKM Ac-2550]|uniref:glycosyltransferase n=1 Tax=Crystallibacter permensis TaxID=1938888 RepID=UPI0022261B1F|nr:glycosyltransferase [Arthrobacter sp. VKM Ac-2550]MCW2131847.1 poly(glycerol-phosphate) alpha-glucosyltransferase [Arthrobacter sp. VKM Ac-2550]
MTEPGTSGSALPAMKYFMVLWGIADNFGGMTTMSLHRGSAFQLHGGRTATIVTFDPKPSYASTVERLQGQGQLAAGTEVLNVFQHYRSKGLGNVDGPLPIDVPVDKGETGLPEVVLDPEGKVFTRTRLRPDGSTVAVRQFYRPDGTEFLRDEAPQDRTGKGLGRFLTLLDISGAPVAQWRQAGDFYRSWLRSLAAGEPSTFIVDSAFASRIVSPLESENIIKFMVLHNSHIASGGDPFKGKMAAGQKLIHENTLAWDGIVFLTQKHRQDYEERFGTASNLFTVSNPKPRVDSLPDFASRSTNGVMVCRLEAQKNVPHAIDVMARVHQVMPQVKLDIYGAGSLREELQTRIDELSLQDVVHLHGHTPNAAAKFETARFSLLTSRNEGQPLSLMESLGRGCPPVSYDIRYGPSDVIDDGENGFLVSAGDVDAAADRVIQLCGGDELAQKMGEVAWDRSIRFSDTAVINQWALAIEKAWDQRAQRVVLSDLSLKLREVGYIASGGLEIAADVLWTQHSGPAAQEVLAANLVIGRRAGGKPAFLPMEVVERMPGRLVVSGSALISDLDRGVDASNNELDIFVQVHGSNVLKTFRVGFPGPTHSWVPYATVHGSLSLKLV